MDEQTPKKAWSLRQEVKKRKTQTIQQSIYVKGSGQLPPVAPSVKPNVLRSTQTVQHVPQPSSSATPSLPRLTLNRRQNLILATSASLLSLLCLGSILLFNSLNMPGTPTIKPLPITDMNSVLEQLKGIGIPIAAIQTLPASNSNWNAQQAIQVDVGQSKERLLVLSYDSSAQASRDGFRIRSREPFQQWHILQISNVLILASLETPPDVIAEISSLLTAHFIAPYRPFLLTATMPP